MSVELLERWLKRKPTEAKPAEAKATLVAMGCEIRLGREGHLVAYHADLIGHPQFPNGVITVNCHYQGKRAVHPAGISDIIKVAKYLRDKDNRT